jgi:hypothetical protein
MKKSIIALLLVYTMQAHSQTEDSSFLNRTEFKVGYFGNIFWDNGLNLGTEYVWKEKEKLKEKRRGQKTITKQLILNGSIGYSTNFTSQTENGLQTYLGLIWRRTNQKRWQFNLELNPLGYYRSFLPETYEVKGDKVTKVKFPGVSYYAPSFAVGLGRIRKGKSHSGWYLNLNTSLRTSYNASILPVFSLQYGHRFNFKKK